MLKAKAGMRWLQC